MAKVLIFLLTSLLFSYHVINAYKAAVVEYSPILGGTPKSTIYLNLYEYQKYIEEASRQSVDIIVFPEYGLTSIVDNPEDYAVILDYSSIELSSLGLLAQENSIYLVVNLLEKVNETTFYNTDVVFDRNGNIILEYRKINLDDETKLTPGPSNQTITFQSDFGVTFGIFTGFDMVFSNPSRRIFEDTAVTDVIFPSAWLSTMPFFNGLSIQHGYAVANGVNLLAANYNNPNKTYTGSGIYLSDGKPTTFLSDAPSNIMIVKEVPQISERENRTVCPTTQFSTNIDYQFGDIDLSQENITTSVCDGQFCCTFDIEVDGGDDTYKIMAFDGLAPYGQTEIHVRICSLVLCQGDNCGVRVESSTKFKKISVYGNFEDSDVSYIPLTLNYDLQPVAESSFCNTNGGSFVQVSTKDEQENVLVFGLFGKVEE